MPVTTMGFEYSRKAVAHSDIDALHQDLLTGMNQFVRHSKPVILTVCTTGLGGAMQLKQYVEQHGDVSGFDVVPLAVSDDEQLRARMSAILNDTIIHCVVGAHDPLLYHIPFIAISEVFGVDPSRLPDLIHLRQKAKEAQRGQTDYEAVYAYLAEHLEHVEIEKLKKLLPAVIGQINSEMAALSFDTDLGLLVHLACAINRTLAGEGTPAILRREQVISGNRDAYRALRAIVRPLERAFKVIFNDDELAALLIIILKL
jgi:transcriptional regulatory protein LevR